MEYVVKNASDNVSFMNNRNKEQCGFILPDMSIDESKDYLKAAKNNADTIFLISPNTAKSRIEKIAKASTGFLYLVAVFGTTGVKTGIKNYTLKAIKNVKRQTKGKIPVGIGFGVSTPEDVRKYVKSKKISSKKI